MQPRLALAGNWKKERWLLMWIRSMFRQGASFAIVLPKELVRAKGWKRGTKLAQTLNVNGQIVIEGLESWIERERAKRKKGGAE